MKHINLTFVALIAACSIDVDPDRDTAADTSEELDTSSSGGQSLDPALDDLDIDSEIDPDSVAPVACGAPLPGFPPLQRCAMGAYTHPSTGQCMRPLGIQCPPSGLTCADLTTTGGAGGWQSITCNSALSGSGSLSGPCSYGTWGGTGCNGIMTMGSLGCNDDPVTSCDFCEDDDPSSCSPGCPETICPIGP